MEKKHVRGVCGALVLAAAVGRAEPVRIALPATPAGNRSVFVSTELPLTGSGDKLDSVRLVEFEPGIWEATFDIPPGLELTADFFSRPVDLSLADPDQANPIGSPQMITTQPVSDFDFPVHVLTDGTATNPEIVIESDVEGFQPVSLPMAVGIAPSGETLLTGAIPAIHRKMGRSYRIVTDEETWPGDGPARIPAAPVWWRFGEAFFYSPEGFDSEPSDSRQTTFVQQFPDFPTRLIRVQLPRGYDDQTGKTYPVLYAMEGERAFTTSGLPDTMDMDGLMREAIRRGEIPEVILVGVDSTAGFFNEYSPDYALSTGMGREFLEELRDVLLPEIASRYRVKPGPEHTSFSGHGLAGLLSYFAASDFNATWGTSISFSPGFLAEEPFQNGGSLIRARRGPGSFGRLYMDYHTLERETDFNSRGLIVRDEMIGSGFVLGRDLQHEVWLAARTPADDWETRVSAAYLWAWKDRLEQSGEQAGAGDLWVLGEAP